MDLSTSTSASTSRLASRVRVRICQSSSANLLAALCATDAAVEKRVRSEPVIRANCNRDQSESRAQAHFGSMRSVVRQLLKASKLEAYERRQQTAIYNQHNSARRVHSDSDSKLRVASRESRAHREYRAQHFDENLADRGEKLLARVYVCESVRML